jgi:zinc protease
MQFPRSSAVSHVLTNGLTLILDARADHPVISTQLWVETGSVNEDQFLGSGLSHFLEHMVFKGTKQYDGTRLASVVQAAGGHWNAYTSFDRTVYYIDGPSTGMEVFLQVLTELVFHPTLPENEFALEKDVIRREIDMGLDDPSNATMRLLFETAYRQDARRLPVIGHRDLFDQLTHSDLVNYHQRRYTPNRAFFVISGDFSESEVLEKITELTANLSRSYEQEPILLCDPQQVSLREAEATFAVPTSRVTVAWKIPSQGHPDTPVFDALATMLGRGQSSYLYQEIREKQELALEIYLWTFTGNHGEGLFAVTAETEPEQRHTVIEAIRAEVKKYASTACDDDLTRAKRQLTVSQFRTLTTASGRASDLGSNWHEARDLNFTSSYLESVQRVTSDDIHRCLQQLCDQQMTITQLNPIECASSKKERIDHQQVDSHRTHTLANGLRIALFPDQRLPLVSMQAALLCGLPTETQATAGINALLAATITQGTTNRTALEISSTLDALGASLHASTGNNSMSVSGSCLAPDLAILLEIFADIVIQPSFPDDAIAREKASQLASIQEDMMDPLSTAFHAARRILFQGNGYGIPGIGTEESVAQLNRSALCTQHESYFHAANMSIALAGSFDADQVILLLEKYLGSMKSGVAYSPAPSLINENSEEVIHLQKKQAVLTIAYPGLAANDPRRFAAAMLHEYCSDMAGPLFTRIREELGLAYQVGATQFHGNDVGMFAFYLSTAPNQLELAKNEMQLEIEKIAHHGIPDAVFEDVRATVLSALVLRQQSPGSIASAASVDMLFGLPATHHREVHERIRELRADDVRTLANAVLLGKSPVVVTVTEDPGV